MVDIKTQGAAERQSLEEIIPLIDAFGCNGDAMYNVRCALEFIADAVPGIERNSSLSKETAHGLNILLLACAAALEVRHG